LFSFILYLSSVSQVNLIPNPSFEDSISIPLDHAEISKCKFWYSLMITPDYFSTYSPTITTGIGSVYVPKNYFGYQHPVHGNYYVGLITKIRNINSPNPTVNIFEAIQTKLPKPLNPNHIYDFTMYYSLADGCGIASNQLQAYFSVNQFSFSTVPLDPNFVFPNSLNYQVQNDTTQFMTDTLNWVPIQGCFMAQGSEEYLSIGNFRDGILSKYLNVNRNVTFTTAPNATNREDFSYYYLDNLSLYDLGYYSGPAAAKKDTTICFNSSLLIGANAKDSAQYVWEPNIALSCTNCPNPVANPTVTTKYYLTKTLCSFVTQDSIVVSVFTPSLNANAGTNKLICLNEFTQLGVNDSTHFANYYWQPNTYLNCTNCAMPLTFPQSNITYTLQKTECNISSTSTVQINVQDCNTTYTVPNIFTPNNDGVNDVWGIQFNHVRDVKEFKLYIYNRWGVTILESTQPNIRWDGYTTAGIPCPDGVYFYVCTFEVNGEKKELKGNVTLVR
jgi:gliding motility-associated-like protein